MAGLYTAAAKAEIRGLLDAAVRSEKYVKGWEDLKKAIQKWGLGWRQREHCTRCGISPQNRGGHGGKGNFPQQPLIKRGGARGACGHAAAPRTRAFPLL